MMMCILCVSDQESQNSTSINQFKNNMEKTLQEKVPKGTEESVEKDFDSNDIIKKNVKTNKFLLNNVEKNLILDKPADENNIDIMEEKPLEFLSDEINKFDETKNEFKQNLQIDIIKEMNYQKIGEQILNQNINLVKDTSSVNSVQKKKNIFKDNSSMGFLQNLEIKNNNNFFGINFLQIPKVKQEKNVFFLANNFWKTAFLFLQQMKPEKSFYIKINTKSIRLSSQKIIKKFGSYKTNLADRYVESIFYSIICLLGLDEKICYLDNDKCSLLIYEIMKLLVPELNLEPFISGINSDDFINQVYRSINIDLYSTFKKHAPINIANKKLVKKLNLLNNKIANKTSKDLWNFIIDNDIFDHIQHLSTNEIIDSVKSSNLTLFKEEIAIILCTKGNIKLLEVSNFNTMITFANLQNEDTFSKYINEYIFFLKNVNCYVLSFGKKNVYFPSDQLYTFKNPFITSFYNLFYDIYTEVPEGMIINYSLNDKDIKNIDKEGFFLSYQKIKIKYNYKIQGIDLSALFFFPVALVFIEYFINGLDIYINNFCFNSSKAFIYRILRDNDIIINLFRLIFIISENKVSTS